jgi:hypothetical protein
VASIEAQHERLWIEERDAWLEYLETTRDARSTLNHFSYEAVEPWAWDRLSSRLGGITKRLKRLEHREERLERRSA